MPVLRLPRKGNPLGCFGMNFSVFIGVGLITIITSKGDFTFILTSIGLIVITMISAKSWQPMDY